MLIFGVILPEDPIADGLWQPCDSVAAYDGAGAYVLLPTLPYIAVYANDRMPEVWRADDRLLTCALAEFIVRLIAQRPHAERTKESLTVVKHVKPGHRNDAPPLEAVLPQMLEPTLAVGKAQEWLRTLLTHGPVATAEIQSLAAQRGFSTATLRRAAAALNVKVARHGFGRGGRWTWRLS